MTKFRDTPMYKYAERVIALEGKQNELFKIILDNKVIKSLVIYLNTDEQLGNQHIDSKGQPLTNAFNDRTTYSLFDKKGRGGKRYELYDTGEFWDSFQVTVGQGYIEITSNPQKDDDNLFEMFGKHIEGLTDENLQVLIEEVKKQIISWYEKNILPK